MTPVKPSHGRLRPLSLTEVHITDGFWAERQAVNGEATLAHIGYWLEREGWLGNLDLAAAARLDAAAVRARPLAAAELGGDVVAGGGARAGPGILGRHVCA